IVVVDDEEQVVDFVARALGDHGAGYIVESARDGYTAGRLVHSLRPELVLLDIRMPGIDGFKVCETIKNDPTTRDTKVLIITAYADQENLGRLLEMGAEGVLEKPFDLATLTGRVRELLGAPVS
ncbi:MAG TPA: response regulator, partial [Planctomycetota bacterium]|nr:response regulator [Planctomycetota bacterium]